MPSDAMPINLDNNATTQPSPGVAGAVARSLSELWHNPSSVHRGGQAARQAVELARKQLAELIHAKPRDLVFTSGGTEALDLAIRGTLAARPETDTPKAMPRNIVTTKVEHAAVRDLAEVLNRTHAVEARWAELDRGGVLTPESLSANLDADTALVCVQWANNETGAIQPIAALYAECKNRNIPMVCDGTQWVGKMPADVSNFATPFDLLVFSPHKFHGPKGVGVLWTRRGMVLRPTIHGTQELGRRGGTENVPGIVGAGVAAQEAGAWLADPSRREAQAALRDRFERAVLAAFPEARVNGPSDLATESPPPLELRARLWNTTNIALPKLEAEALLLLLSERGLFASAGAACSSGSLDPSPVLLAMGVPPDLAHGSLRFSLSKHTTRDEIDAAVAIFVEAVRTLRGSSSSVG